MHSDVRQPRGALALHSAAEPLGHDGAHMHAVQFYDDESYLASVVGDFLAAGLKQGQPAIVIAAPDRQRAFSAHLHTWNVDLRVARKDGRLVLLDARSALSKFMQGSLPDARRFQSFMGPVIESSAASASGGRVCAYGEMVDLLWKDGNAEGAIELEQLWNDLARHHDFSLLCAYAMENFHRPADADFFRRICDQHTRVAPTEAYGQADDAARLVEISVLQQRSRALEAEIAQREDLECRLRNALAQAERSREEADRARAMAEQASRAKSDFLAVMSHELRTPLNAIGGYAELMELGIHGPVSAAQSEALDRIQRSQRMLLGLINQVLNYTRVETGNVRYDITHVPLHETVRETEALVLPQLRAKGLRYRYTGCAADLAVSADREKLQQVLLNLLANAIKFTERDGEIGVDVQIGDRVYLRVRDTGIGIPVEKRESIFEPFVQVNAQYTRTRDGVGLGLAISRDLARGMKGNLTVQSEEGVGSTFTLELPVSFL